MPSKLLIQRDASLNEGGISRTTTLNGVSESRRLSYTVQKACWRLPMHQSILFLWLSLVLRTGSVAFGSSECVSKPGAVAQSPKLNAAVQAAIGHGFTNKSEGSHLIFYKDRMVMDYLSTDSSNGTLERKAGPLQICIDGNDLSFVSAAFDNAKREFEIEGGCFRIRLSFIESGFVPKEKVIFCPGTIPTRVKAACQKDVACTKDFLIPGGSGGQTRGAPK
jgi:hypothetical protein